jgi:hypothetical protein
MVNVKAYVLLLAMVVAKVQLLLPAEVPSTLPGAKRRVL